ncbi:uracil phosphoribosyltransferase [Heyndrickxia sp. NPDC080065]|uniref:uracil phosphoribosyltransferase n=1 Tax=Heyndrickxia sp. NPDC080065 TaxID=3390568 RepID=UPI003CFCFF03
MAKSSAKKMREKLVREGRRNPEENRGIYALSDLRTRKTKTKEEVLRKQKHKGRLSKSYDEDNRPIFLL